MAKMLNVVTPIFKTFEAQWPAWEDRAGRGPKDKHIDAQCWKTGCSSIVESLCCQCQVKEGNVYICELVSCITCWRVSLLQTPHPLRTVAAEKSRKQFAYFQLPSRQGTSLVILVMNDHSTVARMNSRSLTEGGCDVIWKQYACALIQLHRSTAY